MTAQILPLANQSERYIGQKSKPSDGNFKMITINDNDNDNDIDKDNKNSTDYWCLNS